MNNIDGVLVSNRGYVTSKGYEKHLTDKFPGRKLAVPGCMDTRLPGLQRVGYYCYICLYVEKGN